VIRPITAAKIEFCPRTRGNLEIPSRRRTSMSNQTRGELGDERDGQSEETKSRSSKTRSHSQTASCGEEGRVDAQAPSGKQKGREDPDPARGRQKGGDDSQASADR
jgi:hypothetical protein